MGIGTKVTKVLSMIHNAAVVHAVADDLSMPIHLFLKNEIEFVIFFVGRDARKREAEVRNQQTCNIARKAKNDDNERQLPIVWLESHYGLQHSLSFLYFDKYDLCQTRIKLVKYTVVPWWAKETRRMCILFFCFFKLRSRLRLRSRCLPHIQASRLLCRLEQECM